MLQFYICRWFCFIYIPFKFQLGIKEKTWNPAILHVQVGFVLYKFLLKPNYNLKINMDLGGVTIYIYMCGL